MTEEKQIEEMAEMLEIIEKARDEYANDITDHSENEYIREGLLNAGYRKQSEGEWRYNPNGMDWGLGAWECSVCRCRNDNLPMQKDIKPLRWAGTKYCPNCGAKMRGGAE